MVIGTIVLNQLDSYTDEEGDLFPRPKWNKILFDSLVNMNAIAREGYDKLEPNLKKDATVNSMEYTLAVTIRETIRDADIVLVSRIDSREEGKKFDLNRFTRILKNKDVEIWIRNWRLR